MFDRTHPAFFGALCLVAYINLAGRVFANQNDRKAGSEMMRRLQQADLAGNSIDQLI